MNVHSILLDGFRNYEGFFAEFSPEMNVVCGENAQGKTNLVEAIGFLSGAKSYRTRTEQELISFHRQEGFLNAELESRNRSFQVEVSLSRHARRKILVNHVKLKKAGELAGLLRTVLFCPEDLSLVREGAAGRRRFLDLSISQLRPKYAEALSHYQRLLDHKTRILRDFTEKPGLLDVLQEFNDGLAKAGAIIIHYRAHFIRRLLASAEEIQRDFSGGREDLFLIYQTVKTVDDPLAQPSVIYPRLLEHQKSHEQAEFASRSCLSGPHKDDLIAEINGQSARQYASQGQSRTIALSLKLAERELHREDTGQWPVLLLDDVLSELDTRRQEFVLERIRGGQVFITGCEIPALKRTEHKCLTISQGKLQ
ncbi:MAG: replication and repair protein RecF [Evtepia sp.]|jgi:DNA replication and repair protein RecF|nr:replication and repair protein RecF [Evtepia sp.]